MSDSKFDLSDFHFIRVSTPDLNGCHLTKLLSSKLAQRIRDNEVDLFGGTIALGPRTQYVGIKEFVENKSRNAFLYPDMSTLNPLKWADDQKNSFTVAEVIADMRWDENSPVEFHPRIVAKRQLEELERMDLELYSAFEPEFRAFKPNTFEPYTMGLDLYKTTLLAKYEKFFMDAVTKMSIAGVEIQDCLTEHGEGQLEMPLIPSFGISAADQGFRFKQGIKEIASQHDMMISFMTKPFLSESSSGNHFNHSLWYKSTKKNAMYDREKEDNLSDLALYWIGGLIKHLASISALCCPTVNCYRRLHGFISPGRLNWDINDRSCSIRIKNFSEKSTYVENRLPSSAACSYHVLAATVAAGIDGIKNKIKPPNKGDKSAESLPVSFEEALNILDKDEVIKEALGRKFVDYFIEIKRTIDLKEICLENVNEEDMLILERHQYFDYI